MVLFAGLVFFTSPLSSLFAPSFPSHLSSIVLYSDNGLFLCLFLLLVLLLWIVSGTLFFKSFKSLTKTLKYDKTLTKRHIFRISLASPTTHARHAAILMLMLFQVNLAYSRHQASHDQSWSFMFSGIFRSIVSAHKNYIRFVIMTSQWALAGGVMLVFGPVFAPVVAALAPGKGVLPSAPIETRRPLSPEENSSFYDVSWNRFPCYRQFLPCNREAPTSILALDLPQANMDNKASSWTSSHMSTINNLFATDNFLCSGRLHTIYGVAQDRTHVLPSMWGARHYVSHFDPFAQFVDLIHMLFPALLRSYKVLWSHMSVSEQLGCAANLDNLHDVDPGNNGYMSSDDEDDSNIVHGTAPSSPIQSIHQITPTPSIVHPDNSQFSTIAQIGTLTILRNAQSMVTYSPSIIRDARLASAPYSISDSRLGSQQHSRHSSNPATRPPSRTMTLPTTAAAFGLPPSTATPTTPPPAAISQPMPTANLPASHFPFIERISSSLPPISDTLAGIIPAEWSQFKKTVFDYNLSLELYKTDIDWKKVNMEAPTDPTALIDYNNNIGRVNQ